MRWRWVMANANRRRGFSYERRRLGEVFKSGGYGFRAFASKGIVDLCYVDREGTAHLEQLKFSSKGNARISSSELANLIRFAGRFKGSQCHVSLVIKNAWQKEKVYRLNVEGVTEEMTLKELEKILNGD